MVESRKAFTKLILLGDVNVGKTTLINKFAKDDNAAGATNATVGVDFVKKEMRIGNKDVTIQLWDTAGQEKFESIGYAFYRGVNCCLFVFDLSDKASFDNLTKWKNNFIDKAAPNKPDEFPFICVGNKSDKERVVTREQAEQWCQQNGRIPYFETSAISGDNVDTAFVKGAEKGLDNADEEEFAMPTSLSGAAGAIKMDKTDHENRTE